MKALKYGELERMRKLEGGGRWMEVWGAGVKEKGREG